MTNDDEGKQAEVGQNLMEGEERVAYRVSLILSLTGLSDCQRSPLLAPGRWRRLTY